MRHQIGSGREQRPWITCDLGEVGDVPAGRGRPVRAEQPQHGDLDAVNVAGARDDVPGLLPPGQLQLELGQPPEHLPGRVDQHQRHHTSHAAGPYPQRKEGHLLNAFRRRRCPS
ncbi:hypothetical protein ACFQY4_36475 [Catellatospora bangladeshensis]|uniref:hypothetical protein n=1 Tax=Catellatospora bangladeshensis TaxID=310355 RepID=UPI00361A9343